MSERKERIELHRDLKFLPKIWKTENKYFLDRI